MSTTTKNDLVTIEPATGWPYPEMKADLAAGRNVWRETTEEVYYEQLGCMPPLYQWGGAFLISEPMSGFGHDTINAAFVADGGRYFCRLIPRLRFRERVAEILAAITCRYSS